MVPSKSIEELHLELELASIDYNTAVESLRLKRLDTSNDPDILNQCNCLEDEVIIARFKLHAARQALYKTDPYCVELY